tara:strand:+ start:7172 stop:7339 length:168 start_codon:yes stop_codon:yes gene_type:complete
MTLPISWPVGGHARIVHSVIIQIGILWNNKSEQVSSNPKISIGQKDGLLVQPIDI